MGNTSDRGAGGQPVPRSFYFSNKSKKPGTDRLCSILTQEEQISAKNQEMIWQHNLLQ
jgi:hypothetical protein